MAISIDWGTKIISIPKSDLTLVSGSLYTYDINVFRLELKDLEDDFEGMPFPDTHKHNTVVILSGVPYARIVEIINGYTITFEDGLYRVSLGGANNNVIDVTNVNQVSLISNNSAGLVEVCTSSASSSLTAEQEEQLANSEIWARQAATQRFN